MDRLNFNHFYYFYVVAMEGTIKAASEKLFVSQPTISDQIKLLEEYFQCSLFSRQNRSLVLTEEGKIALNYAKKTFDLAYEVTSRLRSSIDLPKKSVDIGVSLFMSNYFLYESIIPLFKHQETAINIKEKERHLLLADLEMGKIDLVFTDSKDGISSAMEAYRVGVNKTYAVAHKSFKKHQRKFPQSLGEIPFFNYTHESFLKYEIELFFSKNSVSPIVIGEADDLDMLEVVTRNKLAFTIVPEVAMQRMCQNKDIIVLGELEELQTYAYGIIKKGYRGLGFELLTMNKRKRSE